jgi:hypothetical protein
MSMQTTFPLRRAAITAVLGLLAALPIALEQFAP